MIMKKGVVNANTTHIVRKIADVDANAIFILIKSTPENMKLGENHFLVGKLSRYETSMNFKYNFQLQIFSNFIYVAPTFTIAD